MIYYMNLDDGPFHLIQDGLKTVEMRLSNKDRENIVKGDHIVFTNHTNGKQMEVLVLNIDKFPTFFELYKAFDKDQLGYKEDENADPEDMYRYYKKEDIEKYGVLAITIKKL